MQIYNMQAVFVSRRELNLLTYPHLWRKLAFLNRNNTRGISMSTKVISVKNLPARLPITSTAVFYLLMDNLNASPVAWGVGITLVVILWIIAITAICMQEHVDVINRR